ncbi:hypothetical protein IEO21_05282 [Rhodonia placenta]|uniref:Uncharacterized protein n=1 Tax=Rhodonia placenta TaxID=104341 RepID=A0A8H7U2F4_9APHY|nr:hypothetical protein IEO21_05282 [Postia placenta]
MRIPLITPSEPSLKQLFPRKGGGGGHGGGSSGKGGSGSSSGSKGGSGSSSGSKGGSGSSSGGKGGSSGSSSSGKSQSIPLSGSTGGKKTATTYGSGGGRAVTIPAGQPFAGRTSGGGTRGQVYGTSTYGSGYPGLAAGSVLGRGFPFIFWPVVWGGGLGLGGAYLHDHEYGSPTNASRPGGALTQATFTSNSTNSTFWVVADNATVSALITTIYDNCTLGSNSSTAPTPFSGNASQAQPEQVIQYYRASSVALALDGYNDTAKLTNPNATDVPLPSWMDTQLEGCLNATIAASVPLVSAADMRWQPPVGIIGLVWLIVLFWL